MNKSKKIQTSRITTMKISEEVKNRLDHLKEHEKESYNEVIKKAMNILNICMRSPVLAARILRDIERNKKREKLIDNPELFKKRQQTSQTSNISGTNLNRRIVSNNNRRMA